MSNLILVRHGQSKWNLQNRFTGWYDVELSDNGIKEAKRAGNLIKDLDILIGHAYTSYLKRAINTLQIILEVSDLKNINSTEAWELNERHYGSLTGLNKDEIKNKIGEERVKIYRRSWDVAPPEIDIEDKNNPSKLKIFQKLGSTVPTTESLKDTYNRVIPYYKKEIEPRIIKGENVLIVAHGNSLRALCKKILTISNQKINELEIPTGNPLLLDLNEKFEILSSRYLDIARSQKIFL